MKEGDEMKQIGEKNQMGKVGRANSWAAADQGRGRSGRREKMTCGKCAMVKSATGEKSPKISEG